jgi:hypothetical protein
MGTPDPQQCGESWVEAWNAHDIESVLAHSHDDVLFTSPVATQVIPDSGGVVRGKEALRAYWAAALAAWPICTSTSSVSTAVKSVLVINYRNQRGGLANEVLVFDGGLVREGHGTYVD